MKQEILKNKTIIITDRSFTINTDGPLLASFIKLKKNSRILDLCTGNGIIPIWLYDRGFMNETVALDIQAQAIDLLNKTIKLNRIEGITTIVTDLTNYISKEKYDIVCCNPPYYDRSSFPASPDEKRRIVRSFDGDGITNVMISAKRNIKQSGSFYCCFPPSCMKSFFEAMIKVGFSPKRIQFVRYNESMTPFVALMEAGQKQSVSLEILPDIPAKINGKNNEVFDDIFSMGRIDD